MLRPILLAALALAAPGWASPTYPAAVQTHLALGAPPPCSLCHAGGAGSATTVKTPFGLSLLAAGAVGGGNVARLTAALDAMQTAGTDSDHDGFPDIAELVKNMDPNVPNSADGGVAPGGVVPPPPMQYGCGASVTPGLLGALGVLAFLSRRRRASATLAGP
jgi:MYXO-CTERM domain-containing protein